MIEAIKKLENTKYQNRYKYTKGVSYNYGLKLGINEIKNNSDYESILSGIKETLKLVLTDVRFSDECYEGLMDAFVIIKNYINLHRRYLEMCDEEFKYFKNVDYMVSENIVYIYTEDMPTLNLIDEVREIMKSYGFIVDTSYNFDLNRNEFKVIGMTI